MLLAWYTIKVHTWPEATLFNSHNLCIVTKEGIVLLKYWGGQEMSQPDDRGLEILNVPSEARSAEGWCLGSGFCSPKFKSKLGASSSPFFGLTFFHFRAQPSSPSPSGSVSFLPPLHGPIRPFFLPFFCTPLPYALSPFPSTFPPPILVLSSSLSRGAPHPARGSVSSLADPGRARPTNGLWTAFWGQNSYSGDSD